MKKLSQKIRHKISSAKHRFGNSGTKTSPEAQQNLLAEKTMAAAQASTAKQWARAEALWRACIMAFNDNAPAEAYRQLSIAERRQLKFEQATQTVVVGREKHPHDLMLSVEYAEVATAAKDWSVAIERWRELIQDNPSAKSMPKYVARLVHCLEKNGDYKTALSTVELELTKHPDSQELLLVRAYTFFAEKKWNQAIDAFKQLLRTHGNLPANAWVALAQSLRHSEKYTEAEKTIREGLEKTNDPWLKIEWAEIPTQQENWKVAAVRWRELAEKFVSADWLKDEKIKLVIRFNESVVRNLVNSKKYIQEVQRYAKQTKKRKYVICTSFSAGYDTLKLPAVIDDRFDCVVYTDEHVSGYGVYDVRPFPVAEKDNGRTIRYIKTHPHELFANYEAVIWIDSSMLITESLYPLLERFLKTGKPIASTPHQHRQTIQEELEACILRKKDDPSIMKKQVARYEAAGFDGKILAENGLLMFNLKSNKLPGVMKTWWYEIKNFSKRDQLSFGYALFKNAADWHHIVDKPSHIRNMPEVVLTAHHDTSFALTKLNELVDKHV